MKWLSVLSKTVAKVYAMVIAGTPTLVVLMILFYLVFTPLSTWWTAVLTGEALGWNEYLVLAFTMAINLSTEFLFNRFVVFGKSINTAEKK